MSGESAYQLYEGFKVVLPLAPIALVLAATISLHRKEKRQLTRWMVISMTVSLLFAAFAYVTLALEQHVFDAAYPELYRSWIYLHIPEVGSTIADVAFICFTILFLRYFRTSGSAGSVLPLQSSS